MTTQERARALCLVASRIMQWQHIGVDVDSDETTEGFFEGSCDVVFRVLNRKSREWLPDTSWTDAGMLFDALSPMFRRVELHSVECMYCVLIGDGIDEMNEGYVLEADGATPQAAIFAAALKVAESMEVQGG